MRKLQKETKMATAQQLAKELAMWTKISTRRKRMTKLIIITYNSYLNTLKAFGTEG